MFTDIFALPDECFAPVAPPSPFVEPPIDPDIVLADENADPEDLIFQGINLTKTTERMWAKPVTDLPDWIRPLSPEASTAEIATPATTATPEAEPGAAAATQQTTATAATSDPEPSSAATSPGASHPDPSVEVINVDALKSSVPGSPVSAPTRGPQQLFSSSFPLPQPQHLHPIHALQLSAYNMALYQQLLRQSMAAPQLAYAAPALQHPQVLFSQYGQPLSGPKSSGRVSTPPSVKKRAVPYTKPVKDWKEIPTAKSTSSAKKQRAPKKQREPCPPPATMPFPAQLPAGYANARMHATGYQGSGAVTGASSPHFVYSY